MNKTLFMGLAAAAGLWFYSKKQAGAVASPAMATAGTDREQKSSLAQAVTQAAAAVPPAQAATSGASFGGGSSMAAPSVQAAQIQFDNTAINPVNQYPVGFNAGTMKLGLM